MKMHSDEMSIEKYKKVSSLDRIALVASSGSYASVIIFWSSAKVVINCSPSLAHEQLRMIPLVHRIALPCT